MRTNEAIDVRKGDYRVYNGTVDQDVRGDDGRLAIRRGSPVELVVRFAPGNDLILDLDSITTNGQRYAVKADTKRAESQRDNSLVGAIFGALNGGEVQGQAVRVTPNTVVTFRLMRPLDVGVPDRGIMRDGRHYHDYDRDRYGQGWYREQDRNGRGGQYPNANQYPNRWSRYTLPFIRRINRKSETCRIRLSECPNLRGCESIGASTDENRISEPDPPRLPL